ncbi:MAG: hypothetical protein HFJ80_00555 [Clostridiales bacterium]|nr:hypothetical protein [Clostridiales bacterium]
MKNTFWIHVVIGVLTIVPLILFNVRRIWVRRPPDPLKFKVGRCIVIGVICVLIGAFLAASYQTAMSTRYEIAIERLARKQAEMLTGQLPAAEFRSFLLENGGEELAASFDRAAEDSAGLRTEGGYDEVRFQFSNWLIPRYWEGKEGFEQVPVLSNENPIYIRYVIDTGETELTYAVRMRFTGERWLYEWIGVPNDTQLKDLKMSPGGKWFAVRA